MNLAKRTTLALLLLLGMAASVEGRTWTVNKALPADFTAIQPALDAASPGDTVLVGPGRWVDYQRVWLPGWPYSVRVCAYVHVDSLTIRGADRSGTIIGPSSPPSFANLEPEGIVADSVSFLRVEHLTVENLYAGAFLTNGSFAVGSANFKSCGVGIDGDTTSQFVVADCDFSSCDGSGCALFRISGDGLVTNCRFTSCAIGVNIDSAASFLVSNCTFMGGGTGAQFVDHTTASIENCRMSGCWSSGIYVSGATTLALSAVDIVGGYNNLNIDGHSHVSGEQVVLHGGSLATVSSGAGLPELHNSHILGIGGDALLVELSSYVTAPVHLDLRNNYWGIADRDSIAALIWDGNDDPNIHGFVDFEPFSTTPLPTEKKSLGGVKGMFR